MVAYVYIVVFQCNRHNSPTSNCRFCNNHLIFYCSRSNCDPAVANILRQYYQKPYFLPSVAESGSTDWIFMGSPGFGAPMHVSLVLNHVVFYLFF